MTEPLHEAFLERVATAVEERQSDSPLAGFLLARLLTRLTDRPPPNASAISYQVNGLRAFLIDADLTSEERASLTAVLDALAADDARATGFIRAVCDHAFWLEGQLRLDEARDLLETVEPLCDRDAAARVHALLQLARVYRMDGQFDRARATYANAGDLAAAAGDDHNERLSRIGRAIVHQKTGNLPESERTLRAVLHESKEAGDRDAEARASHDLAVALDIMERDAEAVPLAFRAFELYDDESRKLRALSDLGCLFKDLGVFTAAEDAFTVVVHRAPGPEVRTHAMLELLEVAIMTGDEAAVAHWRPELEAVQHDLTPDDRVEYDLKLGMALAIGGHTEAATRRFEAAVRRATDFGLGELLYRAEAALSQLQAASLVPSEPQPSAPASDRPVKDVARKVEALRRTMSA